MVGIPGRSKGCITCRKRKKGVSSPVNTAMLTSCFILQLRLTTASAISSSQSVDSAKSEARHVADTTLIVSSCTIIVEKTEPVVERQMYRTQARLQAWWSPRSLSRNCSAIPWR
jgi:hypothetical protein